MLSWMHWTVPSAIGFGALFGMLVVLGFLDRARPGYSRKGFLPMATTRGDRVFISVALFIAITFTWLKVAPDLTPWSVAVAGIVGATVVLRWG